MSLFTFYELDSVKQLELSHNTNIVEIKKKLNVANEPKYFQKCTLLLFSAKYSSCKINAK